MASVERRTAESDPKIGQCGRMVLRDVAVLSGEELLLRFGDAAPQQLIDLIVAAIRKGDDDEVAAIDGRLREVERISLRQGTSLPGGAPPGRGG